MVIECDRSTCQPCDIRNARQDPVVLDTLTTPLELGSPKKMQSWSRRVLLPAIQILTTR
jgi:hypothetical protein